MSSTRVVAWLGLALVVGWACLGSLTAAAADAPSPPAGSAAPPALPPNAYLLYEAASKGDTATVEHLLNDEPKLAQLRFDGDITALHGAALADAPRSVELLVAHGAFVDAKGGATQKVTPLFLACLKNHMHTATALLEHKADPNAKGDVPGDDGATDVTPLHFAAIYGNCALASLLVRKGAVLDPQTTNDQATPAEYARRSGHETLRNMLAAYQTFGRVKGQPMADLLVAIDASDSAGVDRVLRRNPGLVKVRLLDDWTPLHIAANAGSRPACDALLARGADPLAREKSTGLTASYRAYRAGFADVCEHLRTFEAKALATTKQHGR